MGDKSKELMLLEMLNDLSYARGRLEACERNIKALLADNDFCRVAERNETNKD